MPVAYPRGMGVSPDRQPRRFAVKRFFVPYALPDTAISLTPYNQSIPNDVHWQSNRLPYPR